MAECATLAFVVVSAVVSKWLVLRWGDCGRSFQDDEGMGLVRMIFSCFPNPSAIPGMRVLIDR